MKQITIIGATAGVGLLTVQQALAKGYRVVTLSRSSDTLPQNDNLTAMIGSATNKEDVKKSIQNSDAVIVAIGTGKSTKATNLYTEAATALIQAQQETQTSIPFIILTGFGAGNSKKYQGFIAKIFFALLLKKIYANKTLMEEMIAASPIKWVIVRPGMLTDTAFTGKYRAIIDYNAAMKINKISRADVADYLIQQATNPTALGKYPALSY